MNGSDVRALRKRLGLTQQHFATYLGFSTSAVQKWERGANATGIHNTVLWLLSDAEAKAGAEAVTSALRETALDRRKMLNSLMRLGCPDHLKG
jgi:transcriptional regulator with XRE-family HTH domain